MEKQEISEISREVDKINIDKELFKFELGKMQKNLVDELNGFGNIQLTPLVIKKPLLTRVRNNISKFFKRIFNVFVPM